MKIFRYEINSRIYIKKIIEINFILRISIILRIFYINYIVDNQNI